MKTLVKIFGTDNFILFVLNFPDLSSTSEPLYFKGKNFSTQELFLLWLPTTSSPCKLGLTFSDFTIVWFKCCHNKFFICSFLQIHWFSIFNSFMMVIFLVGLVSMILMRTLRKDYARYSKDEEMDDMVRCLLLLYFFFFFRHMKLMNSW